MQWLPTPVVAEAYDSVAAARCDTTHWRCAIAISGILASTWTMKSCAPLANYSLRQTVVSGAAGLRTNDAYIAVMATILDDAVLTSDVDYFDAPSVPVETY